MTEQKLAHPKGITEQKLEEFVVSELRWEGPRAEIADAWLIDLLDSLAIMKTVAFIEHEFNITLEDDEIVPKNFETLRALVAFVGGKLAR